MLSSSSCPQKVLVVVVDLLAQLPAGSLWKDMYCSTCLYLQRDRARVSSVRFQSPSLSGPRLMTTTIRGDTQGIGISDEQTKMPLVSLTLAKSTVVP